MGTSIETLSGDAFFRPLADAAFDSEKFKASINNKVAKIRHVALSALVELGVSLIVGVIAILSFTAIPVVIPYVIFGIGLVSSIIIIFFRVIRKAKNTPKLESHPSELNNGPRFQDRNRVILEEISEILTTKHALSDNDAQPDDQVNELIAKIEESESYQQVAIEKFQEFLSNCEYDLKQVSEHGETAIIDDTISELSQRNTWSKIFSLFTKIFSFGLSFSPKSTSIPKRLVSNSRDLLGYPKIFLGWTDIAYQLHRCSLRDVEIEKLEKQSFAIETLADTPDLDPKLEKLFKKHIEPLHDRIEQLKKINRRKKCKQIRTILESSVVTADTVTDFVSNFFDSNTHKNLLKATEATSSGLSAFYNVLSIGFQTDKLISLTRESAIYSKEIKNLLAWQTKHQAFFNTLLPASDDPAWEEWKNNWQNKDVSDQEYVTTIRALNDILSVKIDILRKNRRNSKITRWSQLLKFGLTLVKSAIIIKDILVLCGKALGPAARLAFTVLNLFYTISTLLFQLGKFGFEVYNNRHVIERYRSLTRLYAKFRKHQDSVKSTYAVLEKLEAVPLEARNTGEIAQLREKLHQLSIQEILFNDDMNIISKKYKNNLLKKRFYSYKSNQIDNFKNNLDNLQWLFKDKDDGGINCPNRLFVSELKSFGLVVDTVTQKSIFKFIEKKVKFS